MAPQVPCHDPPWRACTGVQHIQSPLGVCTRLADAGMAHLLVFKEVPALAILACRLGPALTGGL